MTSAELDARLREVVDRYAFRRLDDLLLEEVRRGVELALGVPVDRVEVEGRTLNVRLAPVAEEVVVELVKRPV